MGHGYSGMGVNVAIVGDNISEHADLELIHKHDLIMDNPAEKQFNNTVLAGIIAAKPNYRYIRGIAPNINLHDITIMESVNNHALRPKVIEFLADRELDLLSIGNVKIFNLNFTLFKSDSSTQDSYIEDLLSEATSNICTDGCETKIKDAIFIKGIDLYDDTTSALISNHPSIINVNYLDKSKETNHINQYNLANWISVPMSESGYYICSNASIIGYDCVENLAKHIKPNNSMASAIVTGVVALMLEANPNLKWRDIKFILAKTATEDPLFWEDTEPNVAGYKFHREYGFGVINAEKAVEMASSYTKDLGDLKNKETPYSKSEDHNIDGDVFDRVHFDIKENINIEAITLTYKVDYNNIPSSFENLSLMVMKDDDPKLITIPSYPDQQELKITLNHHYGESSKGEWDFFIRQDKDNQVVNNIQMKMTIYGTETDISKTTE